MEIAATATTLGPVAKSVFFEIAKQVFITSVTKNLTKSSSYNANSTSLKSSEAIHTIDDHVFVNGVRLTDFSHNPKNNITQETKRVQDYLFRLDWNFTHPFLSNCIAQIETSLCDTHTEGNSTILDSNYNHATNVIVTGNSVTTSHTNAVSVGSNASNVQVKNYAERYQELRDLDLKITASCQSLVTSLKNILEAIDVKIQDIYEKIEYNKSKYWSFARTTNYSPYIEELINCCKLFVTRLKMLEDMSRKK